VAVAVIDLIAERLAQSAEVIAQMRDDPGLRSQIARVAELGVRTLNSGGKVLFAGNGGSAADSQHLAGELVSRFGFDRPGLPAIALSTDTSVLTAIANDYGYEAVFARQIEALARPGDLFFAISTSGNSPNIVNALKICRDLAITTVGLTGVGGGAMGDYCDHCLRVPHHQTPRIQEGHILIGHLICELIERSIFADTASEVE
jgi:D-sedoheptulose 7-phosphate isomerase